MAEGGPVTGWPAIPGRTGRRKLILSRGSAACWRGPQTEARHRDSSGTGRGFRRCDAPTLSATLAISACRSNRRAPGPQLGRRPCPPREGSPIAEKKGPGRLRRCARDCPRRAGRPGRHRATAQGRADRPVRRGNDRSGERQTPRGQADGPPRTSVSSLSGSAAGPCPARSSMRRLRNSRLTRPGSSRLGSQPSKRDSTRRLQVRRES